MMNPGTPCKFSKQNACESACPFTLSFCDGSGQRVIQHLAPLKCTQKFSEKGFFF